MVSGGALGIDGAAHRGALAAGGTTTVVLGHADSTWSYPARHAPLFQQVIAAGGALVSMLPDGTAPRRGTFLAAQPADRDARGRGDRDRSGRPLGLAVDRARRASALGRMVAAWPGSRGCERLLAGGAALVESAADAELARARDAATAGRGLSRSGRAAGA